MQKKSLNKKKERKQYIVTLKMEIFSPNNTQMKNSTMKMDKFNPYYE